MNCWNTYSFTPLQNMWIFGYHFYNSSFSQICEFFKYHFTTFFTKEVNIKWLFLDHTLFLTTTQQKNTRTKTKIISGTFLSWGLRSLNPSGQALFALFPEHLASYCEKPTHSPTWSSLCSCLLWLLPVVAESFLPNRRWNKTMFWSGLVILLLLSPVTARRVLKPGLVQC